MQIQNINTVDGSIDAKTMKARATPEFSFTEEQFGTSYPKRSRLESGSDQVSSSKRFKPNEEDEKMIVISKGLTDLNSSPVLANTLLQIFFENAPAEILVRHQDVVIKMKCFMSTEVDQEECIDLTKYLKEKY